MDPSPSFVASAAGVVRLETALPKGDRAGIYLTVGPAIGPFYGYEQVAAPGYAFPLPVKHKVVNSLALPVVGETVTFTAVGGVPVTFDSPTVVVTGVDGIAEVRVRAGSVSGETTIRATTSSGSFFDVTIRVDEVPVLSIVSGNDQGVSAVDLANAPLVCRLTDAFGAPLPGVMVQFTAESGGAAITSVSTVTTDASGLAQCDFLVGPGIGGPGSVLATAANGAVARFEFFTRRLAATQTDTTITLTYRHEHASIPLILVLSPSLPAPGYYATPVGYAWTALTNPGIDFFYLDGWGLFGPADPTLVTDQFGVWSISGPYSPIGPFVSFAVQIISYDVNYAYPDSIGFSNAQILLL